MNKPQRLANIVVLDADIVTRKIRLFGKIAGYPDDEWRGLLSEYALVLSSLKLTTTLIVHPYYDFCEVYFYLCWLSRHESINKFEDTKIGVAQYETTFHDLIYKDWLSTASLYFIDHVEQYKTLQALRGWVKNNGDKINFGSR